MFGLKPTLLLDTISDPINQTVTAAFSHDIQPLPEHHEEHAMTNTALETLTEVTP